MADARRKQDSSSGRFDFLGIAKYITAASVLLTLVAVGMIATRGLNYGVDFRGGIELQVQFSQPVDAGRVRTFMSDAGQPNANVQSLGEDNEFLIRIESVKGNTDEETNKLTQETISKLREGLNATFSAEGVAIRRIDTVGPQVGAELRRNGMLAGFYCLLLILIYVGLRFDYRFAPAAVFCLFHDAILTMGVYALLDWEFSTQTMAAVLTIIGYSLNDTIVIFDRIRENAPLHRGKSMTWIANLSLNETLSRTILTYVTTCLTVVAMYVFADGAIQEFARTMLIGMFLGVYSTIYIATPLMLFIDDLQKKRRQALATT